MVGTFAALLLALGTVEAVTASTVVVNGVSRVVKPRVEVRSGVTYLPVPFFRETTPGDVLGIESTGNRLRFIGNGHVVEMTLGSRRARVDNVSIRSSPPFRDGRVTYVPARTVVEGLGGRISGSRRGMQIVLQFRPAPQPTALTTTPPMPGGPAPTMLTTTPPIPSPTPR